MTLPRSTSFRTALFCSVLLVVLVAVMAVRELLLKRPEQLYLTSAGSVDMCLSCHKEEKLDQAHDVAMMGCASCHLGDPLAITKDEAHKGVVNNPGDLRQVERTCSVEGCHPTDVHKVKNSLMATNRGILGTLLYYWGETESQDTELTVESLLETGETSLALDYYRKLCATCHLWKQKNDMPGALSFSTRRAAAVQPAMCSCRQLNSPQPTVLPVTMSQAERRTPKKHILSSPPRSIKPTVSVAIIVPVVSVFPTLAFLNRKATVHRMKKAT